MRLAAVALLVLLAACSSSASASRPSPSPSHFASPAAASPSPTTSPNGVFPLPPTDPVPQVQQGQCAVPVQQDDFQAQNTIDTGWVLYPQGSEVQPGTFISGGSAATYDTKVGRWLPVEPWAISPDGLFFAYADYDMLSSPAAGMAGGSSLLAAGTLASTGRVELVDATTGQITILYSGSPTYAIAGFTAEGIYLSQVDITMDGDFSSALYLISLAGGAPAAVTGGSRPLDRLGWTVLNGAAWGVDFSSAGGITEGNELVRLNLVTGVTTVMLTKSPGVAVGLLGIDAEGNALVALVSNAVPPFEGSPPPVLPPQLVAVTDPQASVVLWQGADTDAPPVGPVFSDSHGAWIGGVNSLWLIFGNSVARVPTGLSNALFVGSSCLDGS